MAQENTQPEQDSRPPSVSAAFAREVIAIFIGGAIYHRALPRQTPT